MKIKKMKYFIEKFNSEITFDRKTYEILLWACLTNNLEIFAFSEQETT